MEQDDLYDPIRPPRPSSLPPSSLVPSLPPFALPRLPPSLPHSVRPRGILSKVSEERPHLIRRTGSMEEVRTSDGTTDLSLSPQETTFSLPFPSPTRSSLLSPKTPATYATTLNVARALVPSSLPLLEDRQRL